jgi:ParB family chromosome partitioning protein
VSSPTARTLALLRREGYVACVAEAWLPAVRRRRDLFGFADVAAVHPHLSGPLLVQTTSAANLSSRRKKVCGSPAARLWLQCGGRIELHGWERTAAGRWRCRRQAVTGETFPSRTSRRGRGGAAASVPSSTTFTPKQRRLTDDRFPSPAQPSLRGPPRRRSERARRARRAAAVERRPTMKRVLLSIDDVAVGQAPVAQISVGPRHRKDLGDIDALVRSIAEVGLLQPLVIALDGSLTAGRRRLEAVRKLGWERVPAHIVLDLDDARKVLQAERDENTCRKDFTPSEAVAIGAALEELEARAARGRQAKAGEAVGKANRKGAGKASGKLPEASGGDAGQTRDRVAAAVGMSGRTYEKAKAVVAAARKAPGLAEAVKEMDATGKVDAAFKEMKKRKSPPAQAKGERELFTPEAPPPEAPPAAGPVFGGRAHRPRLSHDEFKEKRAARSEQRDLFVRAERLARQVEGQANGQAAKGFVAVAARKWKPARRKKLAEQFRRLASVLGWWAEQLEGEPRTTFAPPGAAATSEGPGAAAGRSGGDAAPRGL